MFLSTIFRDWLNFTFDKLRLGISRWGARLFSAVPITWPARSRRLEMVFLSLGVRTAGTLVSVRVGFLAMNIS